jgi:hypothetical protein
MLTLGIIRRTSVVCKVVVGGCAIILVFYVSWIALDWYRVRITTQVHPTLRTSLGMSRVHPRQAPKKLADILQDAIAQDRSVLRVLNVRDFYSSPLSEIAVLGEFDTNRAVQQTSSTSRLPTILGCFF